MAAFIEEEASMYLWPRYTSPNPPTPVPSHPFPFLKLPREIRDTIYCYALLRPRNGPIDNCTNIVWVHPKRRADSPSKSSEYESRYWGTQESTRLFFVNRQFSNEALEIFYSTYSFRFRYFFDVAIVNATLRDTMSPWARGLISSIGWQFGLLTWSGPPGPDEEKERQVIEAVMASLPNVKRVQLMISITGFDVPEHKVKDIVACALQIASPLSGFAGLSLAENAFETDQRTRVMREVGEALGCRWSKTVDMLS